MTRETVVTFVCTVITVIMVMIVLFSPEFHGEHTAAKRIP